MSKEKVYADIKASTNIITGEEYDDIISGISQIASDMVVQTLGPYGRTTIIDDSNYTYASKDGWAVLNKLRFTDAVYNTIYNTIKQISFKIVNKVGDGTTSALVAANFFLNIVTEYMEDRKFRQIDFLNDLKEVQDKIISNLNTSNEIHFINKNEGASYEDIRKVAYVSSNSNKNLAKIIQDIYKETANPNIYVTYDREPGLNYEIQTGYKFECNTLNHKAYINDDSGICVKKDQNTLVAIFDHNVTYNEHAQLISSLSVYANSVGGEIIIIAPHFDDIITNIIGTTINSFLQQNKVPNIMMMQVPLSMEIHRKYLSDVVLLTNAQVFDYGKVRAFNVMIHNADCNEDEKMEDSLLNIDQYRFTSTDELIETCIGHIRTVNIHSNYAILQDYNDIVNESQYNNTLTEVKAEYEILKEKANKIGSTLTKEFMDAHQRYVKLTGKMGVIKVGGESEAEQHCLKDSVDDAVLACKSAYEFGYVRGMNMCMMHMAKDLREYYDENEDPAKVDICDMIYDVFNNVALAVMGNKYDNDENRSVIITKGDKSHFEDFKNYDILRYCIEHDCGYNLVSETIEDMDHLTVINSVATDIEILKATISVLSLMLTSTQFLSVNKMYNQDVNMKAKIEAKNEETASMVSTVIDTLIEKSRDSKVQKAADKFGTKFVEYIRSLTSLKK